MTKTRASWALGSRGDSEWLSRRPGTYASAGVDREAGGEAVTRIAELARATFGSSVATEIGGFAGAYAWEAVGPGGPYLVASTDGVGTKAQIASAVGRYDTIGLDLVAMNVDDIVVYGARPLFFLDFVMTGAVDPGQVEDIVRGVANGCKQVGCALLGGEVAEHPGTMGRGEFDLVGFVVGSVDRKELITGTSIRPGDRVIGLTAPGLRSDGYSFVRKIFADRSLNEPAYPDADHSLGDELLRPSAILTPMVLDLLRAVDVHGLAHVTGGGIAANAARILPPDCDLVLHRGSWPVPPIFVEMRRSRGITTRAMEDAFGLGIGMVVVVPPEAEEQALQILARGAVPTPTLTIGEVTPGSGRAAFAGASQEVFWREKL